MATALGVKWGGAEAAETGRRLAGDAGKAQAVERAAARVSRKPGER